MLEASERYLRLVQLGWSLEILGNTRCLVVGAGALGNEVIKNLALLGIGSIVVVDMDKIEDSNLTRSVLFRETDVDKSKAVVAAERAMEIDRNVKAVPIVGEFQRFLGLGAFYDFDVVFGCLDNIQARIDLNKSCLQANCLYIDAGLRGIDGDLKIFGKGYEVCFDCLMTKEMREEAWRRYSCLKLRTRDDSRPSGPTAPTISAIIAGLQVQLAVKHLHGMDIPFNHRIAVHGHLNEFSVIRLQRNRNCPAHNNNSLIAANDLISLELNAATATGLELYDAIQKDFGQGVTIDLEFDLITEGYCRKHDHHKTIMKRRGTVYEDEMACPMCREEGRQSIDALLSETFYNQINGSEAFLKHKLIEMQIATQKPVIKAYRLFDNDVEYRYYLLRDHSF